MKGFLSTLNMKLLPGFERKDRTDSDGMSKYFREEMVAMTIDLKSIRSGRADKPSSEGFRSSGLAAGYSSVFCLLALI